MCCYSNHMYDSCELRVRFLEVFYLIKNEGNRRDNLQNNQPEAVIFGSESKEERRYMYSFKSCQCRGRGTPLTKRNNWC